MWLRVPCTLVAGSPGMGKTVLLSTWVAERPDARCAWLSCDRWDHDELRIWTSIAAAFASVEPESVSDALDLLVEGPDDIDDVVASLVNEIGSVVPTDVAHPRRPARRRPLGSRRPGHFRRATPRDDACRDRDPRGSRSADPTLAVPGPTG